MCASQSPVSFIRVTHRSMDDDSFFYLSMVTLPMTTSLKKISLPPPATTNLPVAPQKVSEPLPAPPHSRMPKGSGAGNQSEALGWRVLWPGGRGRQSSIGSTSGFSSLFLFIPWSCSLSLGGLLQDFLFNSHLVSAP